MMFFRNRYKFRQTSEKRLLKGTVPVDSKEITHSGTGRFTWLTMRPMSLFESGDSTGEVKELFEGIDEINLHGMIKDGILVAVWSRIEVVITRRTRNAFAGLAGTRVRIPPTPL